MNIVQNVDITIKMVVDNNKMFSKKEKFIEKHIEKIINQFKFQNQKNINPNSCLCYKNNKTCHESVLNKKEHNCFLCYCPEYDNSKEQGGCLKNNPLKKGKWFFNEKLKSKSNPEGKIWDCSDCCYPHQEEIVRKFLKKSFALKP